VTQASAPDPTIVNLKPTVVGAEDNGRGKPTTSAFSGLQFSGRRSYDTRGVLLNNDRGNARAKAARRRAPSKTPSPIESTIRRLSKGRRGRQQLPRSHRVQEAQEIIFKSILTVNETLQSLSFAAKLRLELGAEQKIKPSSPRAPLQTARCSSTHLCREA